MPTSRVSTGVVGVVLAAGGGRRYGMPKVLVPGWLDDRLRALEPCAQRAVVLGAVPDVGLPAGVEAIPAPDWASGQAASVRAAVAYAETTAHEALLIALVDTPGLTAQIVCRVLAHAGAEALARATYNGRPGHPVLVGRAHWAALAESLRGDEGAKGFLAAREVRAVECGDLDDGHDQDEPR